MANNNDPTDLRGQELAAEAQEVVAAEHLRREQDDLRWLLGHPQGRRISQRLMEQTGIYRTSFNHSGSVMAFNEGRRDIGLWFTAQLSDAAPDGFIKVLAEHRTKK